MSTSPPACLRTDARYAALREMGRDRAAQGGVPRRARPRARRQHPPGREDTRCARFARAAGFSRGRDPVARPRHRREHDDLHVRQRRAPSTAAVSRLRPAGDSARAPLGSAGTVNVHPAELPRVAQAARDRSRRSRWCRLLRSTCSAATAPNRLRGSRRQRSCFASSGSHPPWAARSRRRRHDRANDDVVILGHGFWQRSFGGDPGVLGRRLHCRTVRSRSSASRRRAFASALLEPDAYTPLPIDPANPGRHRLALVPVLRSAEAAASARHRQGGNDRDRVRPCRGSIRLDKGMGVFVSGLHEYLVREGRPALRLLMAVVATVLVIACVNLAGLLMARGMDRRGELALRASLGASRATSGQTTASSRASCWRCSAARRDSCSRTGRRRRS